MQEVFISNVKELAILQKAKYIDRPWQEELTSEISEQEV